MLRILLYTKSAAKNLSTLNFTNLKYSTLRNLSNVIIPLQSVLATQAVRSKVETSVQHDFYAISKRFYSTKKSKGSKVLKISDQTQYNQN